MSIEQQLRASVDSLDVTLPADLAARAVRGGRRRQYRRRTALGSVGLLGVAGGVAATVHRGGAGSAVRYASDTTSYVQNGVTFEVPRDLSLIATSDRGMSFADGDGVITVLVTRYENDPYFARTPVMKDLGHGVLFRVSGSDGPTMQAIAATATDEYDGTSVTVSGLAVPVPPNFQVLRVTGPDEGTGIVKSRSTIELQRHTGGTSDPEGPGSLTVVMNAFAPDAIIDFDALGTSEDADGVVTGHAGFVSADRRTTTTVQVTGHGVDRGVVAQLLQGIHYG